MRGSIVLLVVLLALLAIFTMQNPEVVTVRFLAFTGNTLLLVVVVGAFAAGVFGAGLAALPGYFRRRGEIKTAQQRILDLETETKALREEIYQLRKKLDVSKEAPKPGGTG